MVRIITFFWLLAATWQTALAQQTAQFETTFYFEDAVGNRDSVVIGYDTLATNDIDLNFGEQELLSPFDSIFEIRAGTSYFLLRDKLSKRIINRGSAPTGPFPLGNCYSGLNIFIYVWAKHQPVKVWWDRTVFLEPRCYRASVLFNHWLDELAGPISPDDIPPEYACLAAEDSIHFDMSEEHLLSNPLFDAFALIRLEKEVEVQIFPNPASEAVWVKTKNGEPIRAVSVFNSTGALVLKATPAGNEYEVDVWALPPGAYWVEIALPGRRLIRCSQVRRFGIRVPANTEPANTEPANTASPPLAPVMNITPTVEKNHSRLLSLILLLKVFDSH